VTLDAIITTENDVLSEILAEDSRQTRIGFSRAGRKVAQRLAQMPGQALIGKGTAQAVKHWAGTAALTHSWEKDKGVNLAIGVKILSVTGSMFESEEARKRISAVSKSRRTRRSGKLRAALLIVEDDLLCTSAHFKLRAHFL
jgi:hypothetical protein